MIAAGLYFLAVMMSLVLFWYLQRSFLDGLIIYLLNKSAIKKRKKGQTLKEYLLYTRFKTEIPKSFLVFYYFTIVSHLLVSVALVIMALLEYSEDLILKILGILFYFNCGWTTIIGILFWSPGKSFNYGRWISKKKK